MKTIITAIIIVTAITLIVAWTSQSPATTEISAFRDITDKHLAQPDANEIFSLYNLENKWNGAIFHFTDVTNVSYNQEKSAKLEARNEWLSNELDRNKEIAKFKNEVSGIIAYYKKVTIGKDNSSVYVPIARELNRLHESKADKKILLLYSDLMENTSEMSFYDKRNLKLLKTNPVAISKYFEAQIPLQCLQGINIYIIFQPNGIEEDGQFKIVSEFYKKMFEAKGAVVQIVANLN